MGVPFLALILTALLLLSSGAADLAIPPPPSQGSLLYYSAVGRTPYKVSYDERSFVIAGQRSLLLGGAVHYPRVAESEWPAIFSKMRGDGLNMVQTYLFWNIHEPVRGQPYDLKGNKNWTRFVELAGENGLFVSLRVGPFVAAEWDYGTYILINFIHLFTTEECCSCYEMFRFFLLFALQVAFRSG